MNYLNVFDIELDYDFKSKYTAKAKQIKFWFLLGGYKKLLTLNSINAKNV